MKHIARKILFTLLLINTLAINAQSKSDTISQSPIDWHLKLGTEFLSFNNRGEVLTFVAPSFSYKASEKVRINAGVSYVSGLGNFGKVDLSPRRRSTNAYSVYAQAEYRKNERFWFRGTMFYAGGNLGFLPTFSDRTMQNNLCVYGASADFRFKIFDDSALNLHFSFIRDEYGSLPPFFTDYMMFRNSYNPGFDFDIFANPHGF